MPLILPSLFDRLMGSAPKNDREVVTLLEKNIKRDLERLLNHQTMPLFDAQKTDYPEITSSVVNFGIRNYAGLIRNDASMREVTQMIRHAILTYEPRIVPHSLDVVPDIDRELEERVFSDYPKEYKQKIFSKGAFEFIIKGMIATHNIPINFHTKINITDGKTIIE